MKTEIIGFSITILVLLVGILLNRSDNRDTREEVKALRVELYNALRAEMQALRTELRGDINALRIDLKEFYRSLGRHDIEIEHLKKQQTS